MNTSSISWAVVSLSWRHIFGWSAVKDNRSIIDLGSITAEAGRQRTQCIGKIAIILTKQVVSPHFWNANACLW